MPPRPRWSTRRYAVVAGAIATALVATINSAVASTPGVTDVRVSVDTPYVKANGREPSPNDAIRFCGGNRRQQNEPSTAVDPRQTKVIVAGSNDYCTVEGAGGTWTGFYRSEDGGRSFTDSLLPGYPTDDSPEGKASPLQQRGIGNAGDPVQAWDLNGNLYYMGNAFNRSGAGNGSVWVATYDDDAANYVRTVIVGLGTPSRNFQGRFNDKTAIEVDRSKSKHAGNVYAAWSLFNGSGANSIYFARSADHGKTFTKAQKISDGVQGNQFADIAVTSDGTVYVAWRQFPATPRQENAVVWVKSTDGGLRFTKPRVAVTFEEFDATDVAGNPAAAQRAHDEAFARADGPGAEAGEESVGNSRDCGSGPFACRSGFVFFRHDSQVRITADPSDPTNTVYVVFDATKEGTKQPSQTTYNTSEPAADGTPQVGQGRIFLTKTESGGRSWSEPRPISDVPEQGGHQFFPDINADGGYLHAVWHDSRNDPAYSVQYPPGNDGAVRDRGGFAAPTRGLDTYGASSRDGGATWSVARLSRTAQMPNYEMFGDRRVPFHGDYNYVSSVGSFAYNVWTDTRDSEPPNPKDDPRYFGGDGFDVKQCRAPQSGGFGPDTCPNAGGLDQDIFGTATTG